MSTITTIRTHGPRLPMSRDLRRLAYDVWPNIPAAYHGPWINDSGLRVAQAPTHAVSVPNPADLLYRD